MKLGAREAPRFCRAPRLELAGVLMHGPDEGFVASCRRELVGAILGADPDPLRLTRLDAAAVRREPAALDAALRGRGFFAGRGVVLVEGATEGLAGAVGDVLAGTAGEDAFLVVTAGSLPPRSNLRKLFEEARHLACLPLYAEPPTAEEIDARLAGLGLRCGLEEDARSHLAALGLALDRACFDRVLENVALYSLGSDHPLRAEEVGLLGPGGLEAELDAFVDAVAAGRAESVGPTLRRVAATGAGAVTLLLGLQRHFRQLLVFESGGGRAPLWGARRDAVRAQAHRWRRDRLEMAARMLYEADARVRSADRVPALALVERCALRLAMMAER